MQTTIVKWGNSRGIRLSKPLLDSVNLAENDIVQVLVENDSIIIKKAESKKARKTIQERFDGFDGEYEPVSIDCDGPIGKEVW